MTVAERRAYILDSDDDADHGMPTTLVGYLVAAIPDESPGHVTFRLKPFTEDARERYPDPVPGTLPGAWDKLEEFLKQRHLGLVLRRFR